MREILITAACCMMTVQIFGVYYDAFFRANLDAPTVQIVPCGADIIDMARKINVRLTGSCEVES